MKLSQHGISGALAIAVLAGCSYAMAPLPPQLSARFQRQNVQSTSLTQRVQRANLERNAAILTGQAPLPSGEFIRERGTIQGRNMTRQFLMDRLKEYGYQAELHNYRNNGSNVIAHLPAQTPSDAYILVGAHLDSVRNHGADDNNSGSVAVLEAARVLAQLPERRVNLIFAWFDEEELGLIGSKALARHYRETGLKLLSAHTLDMVGYDSDLDGAVEIEQPDAGLWEYYQQANERHDLGIKLYRTGSGSTDHVAFRRAGFHAVGLCEEWVNGDTTPQYHRRGDGYDTLNFDFIAQVTRLSVAAVGDLAQEIPPPMVTVKVPHDRFPSRPRIHHASYDELPLHD